MRRDMANTKASRSAEGVAALRGIDRGQLGPFLAQRGCCDVIDLPFEDLKPSISPVRTRRAIVTGHIAIASARVCGAKS